MLEFDLPKEQSSIIKVIGVGGGGSNAVNYMFEQGIRGVNFVIGNTDSQALEISPVPNKIRLGPELTEGLGAGSNPEIGRLATEESMAEIKAILEKNTKMVFVTAGMGGGTGTGGAPVVAELARSMGILTVGIATTPFFFEGRRKMKQAEEGIELLRQSVDSLIVISNDKIREIYGNLTRSDAFARADNILAIAAKSISEIITVPGQINVDFADVEYVMKNSGVSIMGSAIAEGENRAARAIQAALASPLLNDNDIRGAQKILLNITSGSQQMLIDEITEIHEYVQEATGNETDVIFGTCDDDTLGDKLSVTIIATGFEKNQRGESFTGFSQQSTKVVHSLYTEKRFTNEVEPTVNTEVAEEETPKKADVKPVTIFSLDVNEPVNETEIETDTVDETNMPFHFSFGDDETVDEAIEEPIVHSFEEPVAPSTPFSFYEPEVPAEPVNEDLNFTIKSKDTNELPKAWIPENDPEDKTEEVVALSERIRRLRNLSLKLNNPNNLSELENVPAFKRRNVQLNQVPQSSQPNMSRMSVDENLSEPGEIRRSNSFLHDQVD